MTRKLQLHTAHDNRSLVGELVPSPKLDCHRFKYMLEGSTVPHYIDLPKRVFGGGLAVGARTILSVVITQADLAEVDVPDSPLDVAAAGLVDLNGRKLS